MPHIMKDKKKYGGGSAPGPEYTAGDGIVIENDEISVDEMSAEDMDEIIDELPTGGNIAVTGYVPLGTLISFYGETAPKFFLACDGSTYNKADYPELANHLLSLTNNTPYIVSGDDTKFKVPDLRGEFLRGTGTNSHSASYQGNTVKQGDGANIGTHQNATMIPNTVVQISADGTKGSLGGFSAPDGKYYSPETPDSVVTPSSVKAIWATQGGNTATTSTTRTIFTVRPTNTSVLYCIAYKDIYSDPMNDYSTTEKVVGTWIDGKPIYQKTINFGTLPNNTSKSVAHGISNLGKLISLHGTLDSGNLMSVIPFSYPDGVTYNVGAYVNSVNVTIKTGTDRTTDTAYVTLQYTKTTD